MDWGQTFIYGGVVLLIVGLCLILGGLMKIYPHHSSSTNKTSLSWITGSVGATSLILWLIF